MIGAVAIGDILSVYRKHGWTLRRVLLSEELSSKLAGEGSHLFGGAEIVPSTLDALWFSRASKGSLEAWELRHLSNNPYALVEVMEQDTETAAMNEVFAATELRMLEAINRRN
jgi:hypothetical protein